MQLRLAHPRTDAAAIAAIYAPHVAAGYASFEATAPDADEMGERIAATLQRIPWLVAAIELGLVLGGAYLYYHASVRQAIKVERARQREGQPPRGLRQNALVASGVLALAMVFTLVADFFGIGG